MAINPKNCLDIHQGCVPVFNAHPTLVNTALYCAGMPFCCGEQVREGVGNLMCVVGGNLSIALRLAATSHGTDAAVAENMVSVDESIKRWSMEMVEGAAAAASKIQIRNGQTLGGTALAVSSSIGPLNSSGVEAEVTEGDAAAKWMETVRRLADLKLIFGVTLMYAMLAFVVFLSAVICASWASKKEQGPTAHVAPIYFCGCL